MTWGVEVLSVEISCLCKVLFYMDNDFHLNLVFNYYTQTIVFTLNIESRKGSLHKKCNVFSPKSDFTKKVLYAGISLLIGNRGDHAGLSRRIPQLEL